MAIFEARGRVQLPSPRILSGLTKNLHHKALPRIVRRFGDRARELRRPTIH
jgi:hypothetical protein